MMSCIEDKSPLDAREQYRENLSNRALKSFTATSAPLYSSRMVYAVE